MKSSKTKAKRIILIPILMIGLLIVGFLCSCSEYDDNENDNDNEKITDVLKSNYTNEDIMAVASENLSLLLSLMSKDNINNYGFNSASELEQIQIGIPYLELRLNTDFRIDSDYDYFDKYIINSKKWRIPLIVDNDIRCFMIIYEQSDSLAYSGGGGSEFAKRVDNCEKKYNIQSEKKYFIRNYFDFIMIEYEDDYNIYPIGDSLYFGFKDDSS